MKLKTTDGDTPRRAPPRRRSELPITATGADDQNPTRIGAPLAEALDRPVTALRTVRDQLAQVPAKLSLPVADPAAQQRYVAALYTGQDALSYLVQNGLEQSPEVCARAKQTPGEHVVARGTLSALGETRRVATLGQNLAADGRLLVGAQFSFLWQRLFSIYDRRLSSPDPAVRLGAVRAFASVDKVRFQLLQQAQESRDETAATREELKLTLDQKKDESAFRLALAQMEAGQQPDLATLQAAHRHAALLQNHGGLPLKDDRRGAGR